MMNPFQVNIPVLYILKTPENHRSFGAFRDINREHFPEMRYRETCFQAFSLFIMKKIFSELGKIENYGNLFFNVS